MDKSAMDFYDRVAVVCMAIPYGRVASYGQIALLCGAPGHARQVGFALSHRLDGYAIPAHRIVNHKGCMSGSAAFDYPGLQKQLLLSEGVEVSEDGRVDMKKYAWRHTLEDALRFRRQFQGECEEA